MASVEGHTEAKTLSSTKTHSSPQDFPKRGTQLLWLKGRLNGQPLDMMLDSGVTVCCLAKRCFEASPNLKHARLIPYNDPWPLDANGNFLRPCRIIKEPLTLGTRTSSFSVEFFVIDSLPYSCILGLSFLNQLRSWGVNNETMTFQFNDSFVTVSQDPPLDNMMHLTLTRELNIPAGQSMFVSAVARGPALSSFRPITQVSTLMEGHIPFEQRLQVTVLPTLHLITHQNCVVHTTVVNNIRTIQILHEQLGKVRRLPLVTQIFISILRLPQKLSI